MERRTKVDEEFQRLIPTLPEARGWMSNNPQNQYKGFWYPAGVIRGILLTELEEEQQQLETAAGGKYDNSNILPAADSILLVSCPKAGTTWVKSLIFAITNRGEYSAASSTHPLLTLSSHECFTMVESYDLSNNNNNYNKNHLMNKSLLTTHLPFCSLPDSIKSTCCRIVYVYRDPKDVLISLLHFSNQIRRSNDTSSFLSVEEAVDLFCEGKSFFGPYWDHILTYWEQSLKTPDRILFVSYEELKSNPIDCLNKLASFVGRPFSPEEEKAGVPDNIVDLCSFKKQRDLEVNQPQSLNKIAEKIMKVPNSLFFRKGEVGDYQNHLTQEMINRIDNITRHKLGHIAGFASMLLPG